MVDCEMAFEPVKEYQIMTGMIPERRGKLAVECVKWNADLLI